MTFKEHLEIEQLRLLVKELREDFHQFKLDVSRNYVTLTQHKEALVILKRGLTK